MTRALGPGVPMNVELAQLIAENWLRALGYKVMELEMAGGNNNGAKLQFSTPKVEIVINSEGAVICVAPMVTVPA